MRKLTKCVEYSYVNQKNQKIGRLLVENPCGKVCGECGKVRVFNN